MNWKPGARVRISTENYLLRPMTADDVTDSVVGWFSDPDVMEFVALPMNLTREQIKALLSQADNHRFFVFAIIDKQTSAIIGMYRVWNFPVNDQAKTAVIIGDRAYWGKEAVRETRVALLNFLFNALKLNKVSGMVYTRNMAAVYSYKRLGFRCEGVIRQNDRGRDGKWRDIYAFGLLRDEWQARDWKSQT